MDLLIKQRINQKKRQTVSLTLMALLLIAVSAAVHAGTAHAKEIPRIVPAAQDSNGHETTLQSGAWQTSAPAATTPETTQNTTPSQIKQSSGNDGGSTGIATGLPAVTPEMLTQKVNHMANAIYGMFQGVIISITIIALVVASLFGIIFREARKTVIFALIGLLVVLWAPQIAGFVVHMSRF